MKSKFKKCPLCKKYTLREVCMTCNVPTENPLPAKFSPKDAFGKYRRLMKEGK